MCVPPSSSQPPPPLPPPPPPPRSSSSQASSIYAGRFFVLPPACCCFGSFPFLRVLLLCSRSVDPFALSRTAWHTRGQRNDGMGRDGTSEDRGQRKRFSLLPQFFLSLSFPFPPFSFFTAHTPFCVHHSAFFIPHTAYCLYSNTFDTHSFSLSLLLFFLLPFSFLCSSLSGSVSFQCFPVPSGHCKAGGVCERRDTMLCLRTAGLTYFVC